jgi:tetratricopeptide (TPR) repeat protein
LALLGLAVLYLRRDETDRAVDFYLDALELDPKNRTAKKAMKVIRKQAGTDSFSAWLEAGKLPSLYPPIPFPGFSSKQIGAAVAVLALACIVAFGVLVRFRHIPSPFTPKGTREGVAEFSLTQEERAAPVETGGTYRHILTRDQALSEFEKANALFQAHRDEAARVHLNRILESNAADGIKNRARTVISYMEVPGFDTFRRGDNFSFADVRREPMLYNGVHVIWHGMATNIQTTASGTSFDFLVGYDTRRTLEGIVTVVFDHAVSLNPERPLEILGRIEPLASNAIQLRGLAIHQSGRLENP